jgi:large subunit ribosomal protein L15
MPLHMRLPKLKGFTSPFRVEYQVVNVASLAALFPEGGVVDVAALVQAGAVRRGQPVKVLGNGDISVAVQVSAQKFSDTAAAKIAAAGGSTTVVG